MSLDDHYATIVPALLDGHVVPFLGAGCNLCGRPERESWTFGQSIFLPSGGELSADLAEHFGCQVKDSFDLAHVSQAVSLMHGTGPLYERLRLLFDRDYPYTPVHTFLAALPEAFRQRNEHAQFPLIVTTNYDDLLEKAFRERGEPFDVAMYISEGEHRGKFLHIPHDGTPILVSKPNEYTDLSPTNRTVILKMHGAVYRGEAEQDSYVITEDDYIDYLCRSDLATLVPVALAAKLRRCNFLFLGYSLRDWNLRVILNRIARDRRLSWRSWAIQKHSDTLEKKFWDTHHVEILDVDLEVYVERLRHCLDGRGGNSDAK